MPKKKNREDKNVPVPDDQSLAQAVRKEVEARLWKWVVTACAGFLGVITLLGWLGYDRVIPRMLRKVESRIDTSLRDIEGRIELAKSTAGNAGGVAANAAKSVADVNEHVQRACSEIERDLKKARTDANTAVVKLRRELYQETDRLGNAVTVVRALSSPSNAPPAYDAQSAENAKYCVTVYFNRQTEGLFEKCRRDLAEAGFMVSGLDKTRALAILDDLKWHEEHPRWSLSEVRANTITATKDAVPKALQVRDLLRKGNIDLGDVLDWETFRLRHGDSMLTKVFPNASHLMEIYLFGTEPGAKE